ncbi:hypothetical protein BDV96DRAFT_623606 [Lophiotrema nucula]|uniref:GDP/GTP exchange factor Sec2 N-terminal domain-containing protein n=1 Tax=Lophiotrema nucula TaxID=690887 RepID=A0A6A5YWA9_9PLEO|nr:hypothetical protein BDV96DRAFT_623606 [Lophiotrema nucula]
MAASVAVPPFRAPIIQRRVMSARAHSCPKCGTAVEMGADSRDAKRKILELEAQVEMLKDKATAAVDKCADYEDQLRSLKASPNGLNRSNTSDSLTPEQERSSNEDARPTTASSASAKVSRFSFLTGRRGSPAPNQVAPPPPSTADTQLLEQLAQERALRAKAEQKARQVDLEIEELSVQLFSQANEMVASERKARAKLEARVEQLEKKDKDKAARLERLEKAMNRIDRVKTMLAAPSPAPNGSLSPPRKR